MYDIKNRIFLDLSKTQKSSLCSFLRSLVKNNPNKTVDELLDKFIEDERYYLEVNSSRFEFISELLDDDKFECDVKSFISECRKYYDYKKSQEPILLANKEFEKGKREFLKELKMSKEKPTKKQLFYYNSLCKKFRIEKIDTSSSSKLEMRDLIQGMLNEHKGNREEA